MKELASKREGVVLPSSMTRLHDEMDRLFSRFFGELSPMDIIGSCVVDIREDERKVYVDAELPGLSKDEIEVTLDNGVLIISAEKKIEEEHKDKREDLKERYFGRLYRSLTLPSNVDEGKIKANMKDGVLHITIDKTEETKARKVEIE